MTLLTTVFAAVICTAVWYKNAPRSEMMIGPLCWMYWGASLMWLVDAIFEYAELGAEYFSPAPADMLNDLFLGHTRILPQTWDYYYTQDGEEYILNRLEREKRCGRVSAGERGTYVFTADVYDAMEMLPWIRTFIGRITDLKCSDETVVQRFYEDMETMRAMYGGDGDAVQ